MGLDKVQKRQALRWLDDERAELEAARRIGKKDNADMEEMYYLGAKHMLHAMLGDEEDIMYDQGAKRHVVI